MLHSPEPRQIVIPHPSLRNKLARASLKEATGRDLLDIPGLELLAKRGGSSIPLTKAVLRDYGGVLAEAGFTISLRFEEAEP